MRVVAVSDLHGRLPVIPECDVLVIAGDLCPDNFRFSLDPDQSRRAQREWLMETYRPWELAVPAKRIVMTPGNHDWIVRMPEGIRTEFFVDEGVTIDGKTFWFTPWVPQIGGMWNFEADRRHRKLTAADIPANLDLLVTHAPAFRVGDTTYSGESAGCAELKLALERKQPRFHVFGHIHEGQRFGVREYRTAKTTSFNVAMWGNKWNPLEITL